MLQDERALHLLPPPALCPGPLTAYLDPPQRINAAEDAYLRVLASPDLPACVASGSLALPLAVHRLATAIFGGSDGDGGAASQARRSALFCSAARRLARGGSTNGAGGGGEGQQALGMLLQWSCEEAAEVDTVPRRRLEFIEAACAAAGDENLLAAITTALEA